MASKLSLTDTYTTMDELITILACDVPNWTLLLEKYRPLKISIATSIDNKQRPIFLPERAIELPIGDLLANYFNSTPYKVILCLACLGEGLELIKDTYNDDISSKISQSKAREEMIGKERAKKDKPKKKKEKAKEKEKEIIIKLKIKPESDNFIMIKVRIYHNHCHNTNYIYSKNQQHLFGLNNLTQRYLLIIYLLIVLFAF